MRTWKHGNKVSSLRIERNEEKEKLNYGNYTDISTDINAQVLCFYFMLTIWLLKQFSKYNKYYIRIKYRKEKWGRKEKKKQREGTGREGKNGEGSQRNRQGRKEMER